MSDRSGHQWMAAIGTLLAGLAALLGVVLAVAKSRQGPSQDAVSSPTPKPSAEAPPDEGRAPVAFGHVSSPDAGTRVWDGQWHHVAGTYDGDTLRLYVDGTEVGHGTETSVQIPYGLPTTDDLYIGEFGGRYKKVCANKQHAFLGDVDEVAVWTRALTAGEVSRRSLGQIPGNTSGLGGLWHLDDGKGNTVVDASLNANKGHQRGNPLTWIPGRSSSALRLSGGESVEIADSSTLESQTLTVEASLRASQSPGSLRYVVGKGANSCDVASYGLYTGWDGGLVFYVADATGTAYGSR
jgi:concanavalin A-like lectin/glucanase superfamily protein